MIARFLDLSGPLRVAAVTGVPARTVSRILNRYQLPPLAWCDPLTGERIRGWRSDPTQSLANHRAGHHRVGFDYIRTVIDDHSRVAYSEIHDDEKGTTCAGVLTRAAAFFITCGIPKIERVISDSEFAYHSQAFKDAVVALGAVQKFIKPHCPWTNGKVERFNRTLACPSSPSAATDLVRGDSRPGSSAPLC